MKARKSPALLILLLLTAVVFAGCGRAESGVKDNNDAVLAPNNSIAAATPVGNAAENENAVSVKPAEKTEITDAAAVGNTAEDMNIQDVSSDNPEEPELSPAPVEAENPVSDECVLLDSDEYFIKITDVDPDGFFGFTVTFEIENRTTENKCFSLLRETVNGLYQPALWYEYLEPGEKVSGSMAEWERNLIPGGEITEISFSVGVSGDDYPPEYEAICEHTIYPLGEENVKRFSYEADENDICFIDEDEVAVTVLDYGTDEDSMFVTTFMIENKCDRELTFSISDYTINGIMTQGFGYCTVPAGLTSIYKDSRAVGYSELEGVEEVLKAHYFCRIGEEMSWDDDIAAGAVDVYPLGEEAADVDFLTPSEGEVIAGNENLTVTVLGYEYDPYSGNYYIVTDIVNHSEEPVAVGFENIRVNNFYVYDMNMTVVNGQSRTRVWVDTRFFTLTDYCSEIVRVDLAVAVYNMDDYYSYGYDMPADETILPVTHCVLYPNGEELSALLKDYSPESDAELLLDSAGVVAYVTGYSVNADGSLVAAVYFENQNDYTVVLNCLYSEVNGKEIFLGFENCLIPGGAKKVEEICWGCWSLEGAGISVDDIERIDMTIDIYDPGDWAAGPVVVESWLTPANIVHEEQ